MFSHTNPSDKQKRQEAEMHIVNIQKKLLICEDMVLKKMRDLGGSQEDDKQELEEIDELVALKVIPYLRGVSNQNL